MVHISRLRKPPLLQALLAIRMLQDEALPKRLPSAAVAALCGRSPHLATTFLAPGFRLGLEFSVAFGTCLGMSFAVALASGDGRVASRIGAECKKGHDSEEEKGGEPPDRRRTGGHRPELRVESKSIKRTTLR